MGSGAGTDQEQTMSRRLVVRPEAEAEFSSWKTTSASLSCPSILTPLEV